MSCCIYISGQCAHNTHSRQAKKIFLDLLKRRLNKWDGRKKVEPPSEEVSASLETTPTPQEPLTPTSVSDRLPTVELISISSSIQPVPVNAVAMTNSHLEGGNVYQNTTAGTLGGVSGISGVSGGVYQSTSDGALGGVNGVSGVSGGVGGGERLVEYGSSMNLVSPPLVHPSAFMATGAEHQRLQRTPVQQHQGTGACACNLSLCT